MIERHDADVHECLRTHPDVLVRGLLPELRQRVVHLRRADRRFVALAPRGIGHALRGCYAAPECIAAAEEHDVTAVQRQL